MRLRRDRQNRIRLRRDRQNKMMMVLNCVVVAGIISMLWLAIADSMNDTQMLTIATTDGMNNVLVETPEQVTKNIDKSRVVRMNKKNVARLDQLLSVEKIKEEITTTKKQGDNLLAKAVAMMLTEAPIEQSKIHGDVAAKTKKKVIMAGAEAAMAQKKVTKTVITKAIFPSDTKFQVEKDIIEALSQSELELATVKKGEGIEHSLIRQLISNPSIIAGEYAFAGGDEAEKKKWAQRIAHRIVEGSGIKECNGNREVRVKSPDKIVYHLKADVTGKLIIQQYAKDKEGNFKTIPDRILQVSLELGCDNVVFQSAHDTAHEYLFSVPT